MPRAAVALATPESRAESGRAGPRGFRLRRLHLVLIGLAIIGVWLVFVFARALGDVDHATSRQQTVADEASALQARLDADRRELVLVQTDAFQRLQARAYGLGGRGRAGVLAAAGRAVTPTDHSARRRSEVRDQGHQFRVSAGCLAEADLRELTGG